MVPISSYKVDTATAPLVCKPATTTLPMELCDAAIWMEPPTETRLVMLTKDMPPEDEEVPAVIVRPFVRERLLPIMVTLLRNPLVVETVMLFAEARPSNRDEPMDTAEEVPFVATLMSANGHEHENESVRAS